MFAPQRARRTAGALAPLLSIALCVTLPLRGEGAERLAGNILAVDVERREITLLDAGHRHLIEVAPDASIRASGQDRTLDHLNRGDRIVVTLVEGEPTRAARVVIAGPGHVGPGSLHSGATVPGFASGLNARNPPR